MLCVGGSAAAAQSPLPLARGDTLAGDSLAPVVVTAERRETDLQDTPISVLAFTPQVMETIVEKFVLQLEAQLAERHVAITLTPEARFWLAHKGYDPIYGARPLGRVVQKEVRDPLTDEILFGRLEQGGTVTIGEADGKLIFSYEGREPAKTSQEAGQLGSLEAET